MLSFWSFEFRSLGIVSKFVLRISDLIKVFPINLFRFKHRPFFADVEVAPARGCRPFHSAPLTGTQSARHVGFQGNFAGDSQRHAHLSHFLEHRPGTACADRHISFDPLRRNSSRRSVTSPRRPWVPSSVATRNPVCSPVIFCGERMCLAERNPIIKTVSFSL